MQYIMSLVDLALHFDAHLRAFAVDYGAWVYLVLFLIVFCETGLVVTPFLPGDSILFMIGALGAAGILDFPLAAGLLVAAAVLGDTVNYHIGAYIGPKAFSNDQARFFKKENLVKAHAFYEKWGGFAIFLGRFMPIIRTFVPFASGIGKMGYAKFLAYNLAGGITWVMLFMCGGYFFGEIPVIKEHITLFALAIVFVSCVPIAIGFLGSRKEKKPA